MCLTIKQLFNCVSTQGFKYHGGTCFKYLGTQVAADGGCERDVVHIMN